MTPQLRNLCRCALLAALTAACSQLVILIPLTPVPFNLATFAVFLAGGLLGAKYGFLSMTAYLLLGAAGLPVFSSFRGGLAVLAGPTGGYLAGYPAAAAVTGLLTQRSGSPAWRRAGAMVLGLAACYGLGTAWYCYSTGTPLLPALSACVFPFLPGDALKTASACLLWRRLEKPLKLGESRRGPLPFKD